MAICTSTGKRFSLSPGERARVRGNAALELQRIGFSPRSGDSADAVGRVTAAEAVHDETAEEIGGRGSVARPVVGELRFAEGELEGATVGEFVGIGEKFGMGHEEAAHFGGGAEMVLAIEALFGMWLAKEREGADALDDVVFPTVGRRGVVDRETSNGWMDRWINGLRFQGVGGVDFEVEAVWEKGSEVGRGAEGEKAVGGGRGIEN